MSPQQEIIDCDELLTLANEMLLTHEHYFPEFSVTGVQQKNDVLVFSSDYFLDEQGLPGPKTPLVFNMLKHLAVELSPRYTLKK